jgi:very-short-patch-repair endonuclease
MSLLDNHLIQQHLDAAMKFALANMQTPLWATLTSAIQDSEDPEHPESQHPFGSPLEAVFAVWFEAAQFPFREFEIQRQVTVSGADGKNYRFDFVLQSHLSPKVELRIAVELDGHTFHEKTREQVTSRNRRDRALQRAGYQVFHFSYSEMTREPAQCIAEVIAAARESYANAEPPMPEAE